MAPMPMTSRSESPDRRTAETVGSAAIGHRQPAETVGTGLGRASCATTRVGAAGPSCAPGEVTSLTPIIPNRPVTPTLPVAAAKHPRPAREILASNGVEGNAVPPYLRLGNVCISPSALWISRACGATRMRGRASAPVSPTFLITTRSPAIERIPLQPAELPHRLPDRWQFQGRSLHRLQRNRLQRHQRRQQPHQYQRFAACPVFVCSGWMCARARLNSSPARAGAC